MKKDDVTRILLFSLCFLVFFLFASSAMAAQSSPAKTRASNVTVNADTVTKAEVGASENTVKSRRKEILAKALRVSLGQDFKAYFTLEPPRGIEAVREELQSKTIYRAIFGVNIPL
ncbi:MAG: hypothetical protein P8Z71_11260 [Candidatus Sulfobium sp.]